LLTISHVIIAEEHQRVLLLKQGTFLVVALGGYKSKAVWGFLPNPRTQGPKVA